MSEDYQSPTYSSFWPLTILIGGLILWFGYQDIALARQNSFLNSQLNKAVPTIEAAGNWTARYGELMKDLMQTSKESPFANAIYNEAVRAGVQTGLIQVNQNAAAAPASSSAAPAKP